MIGREADCAGLLNQRTGEPRPTGSNPVSSVAGSPGVTWIGRSDQKPYKDDVGHVDDVLGHKFKDSWQSGRLH